MGWPRIALVASPDASAAVLYEFNVDLTRDVAHAGFDLGAPQWSGEPGQSGGMDGYRTIRFTHWLDNPAALSALPTLGPLLTSASGWLLIQLRDGAAPRWARVWRSSPGVMSWDRLMMSDAMTVFGRHGVDIALTADPYLVGEQLTLANAVTVNNDPASGTNPCRLVLGAVVGDAPAPAIVTVTPASPASAFTYYQWLASVHSGPTQRTPVVWQIGTGDGFTAGTDTGGGVADSTYSGGSYRSVSFSTVSSQAERLSGSTPAALVPGLYKVLIRVARSDTSSKFSLAFGISDTVTFKTIYGATKYMDRATTTSVGFATWVDLGDFQWPVGVEIADAALLTNTAPSISLLGSRTSGTGAIRLDCLMLIPLETVDTLDATTLVDSFTGGAPTTVTWDGETERVWGAGASNTAALMFQSVRGGFPEVAPGTSVLTLLRQVDSGSVTNTIDNPDSIVSTTSVTVKYRPRWLWPAA